MPMNTGQPEREAMTERMGNERFNRGIGPYSEDREDFHNEGGRARDAEIALLNRNKKLENKIRDLENEIARLKKLIKEPT